VSELRTDSFLLQSEQSEPPGFGARFRSPSKSSRQGGRSSSGDVVQLVRTLPCHGRGRGFESRRPRHSFQSLIGIPFWALLSKTVR
jgi:hypothetical protein